MFWPFGGNMVTCRCKPLPFNNTGISIAEPKKKGELVGISLSYA